MEDVRGAFDVRADAEVTLEVNPSSSSLQRARAWRAAGFNRVSVGVQSTHADILGFLGRVHDADRAIAAVREVREAGFDNVSADLIYAVPGLDDRRWEQTLGTRRRSRPRPRVVLRAHRRGAARRCTAPSRRGTRACRRPGHGAAPAPHRRRQAGGRRLRPVRGEQLRPCGAPVRAQPGVLAQRALRRRRRRRARPPPRRAGRGLRARPPRQVHSPSATSTAATWPATWPTAPSRRWRLRSVEWIDAAMRDRGVDHARPASARGCAPRPTRKRWARRASSPPPGFLELDGARATVTAARRGRAQPGGAAARPGALTVAAAGAAVVAV